MRNSLFVNNHLVYLFIPTYIDKYITYIYMLCIYICTLYINFAVIFRTNPVLIHDGVKYNFAEIQVHIKISSFLELLFLSVHKISLCWGQDVGTNWQLSSYVNPQGCFFTHLEEAADWKTLIAGLQLSSMFWNPPQSILGCGHYKLTSSTSPFSELQFNSWVKLYLQN